MIYEALRALELKHRFRDPLYGYIELSEDETKIIDTPIFQRLRRIHQLALTKYVYPGAEHSRFQHSIGVVQAATDIFTCLYNDMAKNNRDELKKLEWDNSETLLCALKTLRFAALLHDIGHLPFSHASEEVLLDKARHENIGRYIIKKHVRISEIIKENNVTPSRVANLIKADPQEIPNSKDNILKSIISGHFDADRADYLRRDSYYCGVKYGVYDYNRYLSSIKIRTTMPSLAFNIVIDNIPILEEFILARYHYNLQVPFHRTRMGYDIALEQYIAYKKENNKGSFANFKNHVTINKSYSEEIDFLDMDWFVTFDDYSILCELNNDASNFWVSCLKRNNHLKMVKEGLSSDKEKQKEYWVSLEKLRKEGFKLNNDYFVKQKNLKIHKLSSNQNTDEKDEEDFHVISRSGENLVLPLAEYSPIFKAFSETTPLLWRIYSNSSKEQDIKTLLRQ
ncbi:HD domain-containing protein [Aminobacterium mobile]|uniref:HD domain-containing protein n=1 Tax=Aminobacterium mobile TaxID=81467 RepID=UPI0004645C5C|nr:HD domain-containing protein [Aminobacterium mobile]